jgi:hypothetical protein
MKSNKITIGLFIYQAVFARTSEPLETKKKNGNQSGKDMTNKKI